MRWIALTLLVSSCTRSAPVDVVLVDDCENDQRLSGVASVRVTVLKEVGFSSDGRLSGCVARARCLERGADFPPLRGFSDLREALRAEDPLLSAEGSAGGLILTGFSASACAPRPSEPSPILFCGAQVGSISEDTGQIFVLLNCQDGAVRREICWPSQFFLPCP